MWFEPRVRYLRACPPEPGIFSASSPLRPSGCFVAAIPFDDSTWWEGPLRWDGSEAAKDLHAEQDLRRWLRERADSAAGVR